MNKVKSSKLKQIYITVKDWFIERKLKKEFKRKVSVLEIEYKNCPVKFFRKDFYDFLIEKDTKEIFIKNGTENSEDRKIFDKYTTSKAYAEFSCKYDAIIRELVNCFYQLSYITYSTERLNECIRYLTEMKKERTK